MTRAIALLALAACGGARPAAPRAPDCGGDRVVTGEDGLAAIVGCRRIDGSLTVHGAAELDLAQLRDLEVVSGDLTIGPTFALASIRLDGLRAVGGKLRLVSNGTATSAVLPMLERAAAIEVAANVDLRRFAAPALRDVDGDVVIVDNLALELVDLAQLARVGGTFTLETTPNLAVVEVPPAFLTESKVVP